MFRTTAQVNVTPGQTAAALAQTLVGTGVTIANPVLACPSNANGIFSVITSNLGLDSGIVLTSGQAATVGGTQGVNGPNTGAGPGVGNGAPGDADLNTVLGITTFDRCVLEFDFIPTGDTIQFNYVFGSTEYLGFSCTSFNDVFGFFVSGPGIVGSKNIAVIPGTNIPICVNSTTGVTTGPMCTAMGPGSPFSMYYINNMGGATITYGGFTQVFTAKTEVIPCTTYHLKLAIADGSDSALDSGIFIEAGSLTSNAISITPVGGGGLSSPVPYCVRGCLPGQFLFSRATPDATPLTIKYSIAGTATNGVDYSFIPDSVIIPAFQTTATRNIFGLPTATPTGPLSVKLYIYSPYACASPTVLDSAELLIFDSIQVSIPTNDTAICKYETVQLEAVGDPLLSFTWTPAAGLNDPNIANPTATPLTTTTYTVAATLPGSGCPAAHDHVTVSIMEEPTVDAGPDRTICLGTPVQFNVTVDPPGQPYVYQWSPGTYLSNSTIANPTANALADITYYIEVSPGAIGCTGYDTVSIRVLPDDIQLINRDTAVCDGASVHIAAFGDPAFDYRWSPGIWTSDSTIIDPVITPDTSVLFTLTASYPGCPDIVKNLFIDVQPNPFVYIGPDRDKCQWDTIQFFPSVVPNTYPYYTYTWTPATGVSDPTSLNIVFSGQTNVLPLTLTVTTPAGCTGDDEVDITVHPGNFGSLTPLDISICPRDSVYYVADGGVTYEWTPAYYLTDPTSPLAVASPPTDMQYTLYITDQYGCLDTFETFINVHPDAVMNFGEDVTIYPGESVQLEPYGNCLYFSWFPPLGLSATNIANPIASPEVNTRYFVTGVTENGCIATDSIDVYVSLESILDVPNAFSPGSQPNAEIKIVRRGLATLKYFRIFNRWGVKVFETSNIDEGWDGQYNGSPQPMGVYVYMLEAYTNTGRRIVKQGNITLLR
jgi:gliding motility-associated-like protein